MVTELKGDLQTAGETGVYRLRRTSLDEVSPEMLRQWSDLLERNPSDAPMHDPEWLRERFGAEKGNVVVYFLYQGESLCGFAPFLAKPWPVKWQLGEITLAQLPLRRHCLLGGAAHFPADSPGYELLFQELAHESDFDTLFLEDIGVDSTLWKLMESDSGINKTFSRYVPDSPAPRVLLRCDGSFEDYMGRFSSKHRKNLRRMLRTFQDASAGEDRSIRVVHRQEVDSFVDQAVEISRKTYQWSLLGLGLREPGDLKKHLSFLADRGWLRCYLLLSKNTPCAFVIGFQYGSRYYLHDMGYDPGWRDFSVGKVLQLKLIEDLFAYNRPEVYDLGEYGAHKDEFGTENYFQGKVFLFRRRAYTGLVRTGHRGCGAITRIASTFLERFGWKSKLKKLIRTWSSGS